MVCDTFALLGIINCNFHKSILPSFVLPSILSSLAQASKGPTWVSQGQAWLPRAWLKPPLA